MRKDADTLKDRVKWRLKMVGLTQVDLGNRLGQSKSNVNSWLRRDSIPTKHLHDVCQILQCDPDWLISGDEKPSTAIDYEALAAILVGTYEAVKEVGLDWDFRQTAKLVVQLYQLYEETGQIPPSFSMAVQLESIRMA